MPVEQHVSVENLLCRTIMIAITNTLLSIQHTRWPVIQARRFGACDLTEYFGVSTTGRRLMLNPQTRITTNSA